MAFLFGLNSITYKIIKPLSEDKGNHIRCGALICSYYVERSCSCSWFFLLLLIKRSCVFRNLETVADLSIKNVFRPWYCDSTRYYISCRWISCGCVWPRDYLSFFFFLINKSIVRECFTIQVKVIVAYSSSLDRLLNCPTPCHQYGLPWVDAAYLCQLEPWVFCLESDLAFG